MAVSEKIKVKGGEREALLSLWSRDYIEELERRLARFGEELNLHISGSNVRITGSESPSSSYNSHTVWKTST